jgi:hypothetical protein
VNDDSSVDAPNSTLLVALVLFGATGAVVVDVGLCERDDPDFTVVLVVPAEDPEVVDVDPEVEPVPLVDDVTVVEVTGLAVVDVLGCHLRDLRDAAAAGSEPKEANAATVDSTTRKLATTRNNLDPFTSQLIVNNDQQLKGYPNFRPRIGRFLKAFTD